MIGATRWYDVDGLRVHAVEWHPNVWSRNGPPVGTSDQTKVVLVHGLGANTVSWEPVGARLADALGATVVAVDLGGFGRTRLPVGRRATVGANGRLLRALIAEEIGPAVVVGNSMGGAIGIGLAARHPELVPALVLVDPALPRSPRDVPPWTVMARFAPLMVPPVGWRVVGLRARALGPARLVDATLGYSLSDPRRLDPAVRKRLVALATERVAYSEAAPAYADAARSLFLMLQRSIVSDLARVQCPTLVVHGELDRLVPVASVHALAARRPDFDVEILDDCGHAPQLECPQRFVDVVGPWLARRATEAAHRA